MTQPIYFKQLELGPMQNYVYLLGDPITREAAVVDAAWDIDAIVETAEARRLPHHARPRHALPPRPSRRRLHGTQRHRRRGARGSGAGQGRHPQGGAAVRAPHHRPVRQRRHRGRGRRRADDREPQGEAAPHAGPHARLAVLPRRTTRSCRATRSSSARAAASTCRARARRTCTAACTTSSATLPDDTVLFPGHNYADRPTSTIGDEKRTNMMLRFRNLKDFLGVMSPLRF